MNKRQRLAQRRSPEYVEAVKQANTLLGIAIVILFIAIVFTYLNTRDLDVLFRGVR